jgi:DNA (cytosine-5)-methyltransferase 1
LFQQNKTKLTNMKFITLCSGIEAASVAWNPLGWECVGVCDFASFPQQVLKHHYPDVPLFPNMLNILEDEKFKKLKAKVIAAGTPCQAWSDAGLGNGMDDERAQLAITFGNILDSKRPTYFIWENVPGVFEEQHKEGLSEIFTNFTGVDIRPEDLQEGGGIFIGKKYSIAYRIFDSRYFGVPQRRRRIVVVGYRGTNWRVPAAILFNEGCFGSVKGENKKKRDERTKNILGEIKLAGTVTKSYSKTLTDGFGKISTSNYWVDDLGIRQFTEKELCRLQGFPDDYFDFEINGQKPSYSSVKGGIGNSWSVPVFRYLGERIQFVDDYLESQKNLVY